MENTGVKAELAKLQRDFVLIPCDKANSNIIIFCKHHYLERHRRKLGIDTKDSEEIKNSPYRRVDKYSRITIFIWYTQDA